MWKRLLSFIASPTLSRRVELDFVRGIAIIAVMGQHFCKQQTPYPLYNAITDGFARFGGYGVDMFFVLSGFLVGGLLLKEWRDTGAIQPRRFLLRRGMKIWPAYYALILFQVVIHRHPLSTFLLANLFHLQNYLGSSIVQTWTLAVEEHFYLLLTFLLVFLARRRITPERLLWILGAMCLVAIALRTGTALAGNSGGALRWTQNRVDSLLFGVIISVLYHLKRPWFDAVARRKALLLAVVAAGLVWLALVPAMSLLGLSLGFTVIYVAVGAFLILVYTHSARVRDLAVYRAVAWIGVYSYGLYLWHSVLRDPSRVVTRHLPGLLQWPLTLALQFALAIILAVALTHLIEWPFLRWRDRVLVPSPEPVAPPWSFWKPVAFWKRRPRPKTL